MHTKNEAFCLLAFYKGGPNWRANSTYERSVMPWRRESVLCIRLWPVCNRAPRTTRLTLFPTPFTINRHHRRLQSVVLTRRTKGTPGHFPGYIYSTAIQYSAPLPDPASNRRVTSPSQDAGETVIKNACRYFSFVHYGQQKQTGNINTAVFIAGYFRGMTHWNYVSFIFIWDAVSFISHWKLNRNKWCH
jgi:hypothetical protein